MSTLNFISVLLFLHLTTYSWTSLSELVQLNYCPYISIFLNKLLIIERYGLHSIICVSFAILLFCLLKCFRPEIR